MRAWYALFLRASEGGHDIDRRFARNNQGKQNKKHMDWIALKLDWILITRVLTLTTRVLHRTDMYQLVWVRRLWVQPYIEV